MNSVRHPPFLGEAYLLDVIGRPARHGGFLFVAVLLEGLLGNRGHHLETCLEQRGLDAFQEDRETLWVRARIGRIFGIAPPSPLGKRCLLDAAFLAVRTARSGPFLEVHPFVCTDSDGEEPIDYEWFDTRVGLVFGPTEPPRRALRSRIADAFWNLLLANPDDLATFGDYYDSYDAGYCVGCDGRNLFCDDLDHTDGEEPDLSPDGFGFNGRWPCPDCDGEGVEFLADLIEQPCETCRGRAWTPGWRTA